MPNIEPLINAAIKGARTVAGIAGKGAKNVGTVYREGVPQDNVKVIGNSKDAVIAQAHQILRRGKEEGAIGKLSSDTAKGNARGLRAAQGPLSKGNRELVNQVKGQANYNVMDRRPTPPSIDKILKTNKNLGPFKAPEQVKEGMKALYSEGKKIAMDEMRRNSAPKKISPAQKALNKGK